MLIVIGVKAAGSELRIIQSFQAILDRDPTATEKTYWSSKSDSDLGQLDSSGYVNIRNRINSAAERSTVINDIYVRALKRNATDSEKSSLLNFVAPTNLIRAQLFGAEERRLAIKDVYVNILGREPEQTDLDFYFVTRSDISDIATVLLSSAERTLMINNLFQQVLSRDATEDEIVIFNAQVPSREGAQWAYYYRDDIWNYVVERDGSSEGQQGQVVAENGLMLSTNNLTIYEGELDTFTVRLLAEPEDTVTLTSTVTSDDNNILVSPASLTFATSNWNIPQTVTVDVTADTWATAYSGTIKVDYPGVGYQEVAVTTMEVSIIQPFYFSPGRTTTEADIEEYLEVLDTIVNDPTYNWVSETKRDIWASEIEDYGSGAKDASWQEPYDGSKYAGTKANEGNSTELDDRAEKLEEFMDYIGEFYNYHTGKYLHIDPVVTVVGEESMGYYWQPVIHAEDNVDMDAMGNTIRTEITNRGLLDPDSGEKGIIFILFVDGAGGWAGAGGNESFGGDALMGDYVTACMGDPDHPATENEAGRL